MIKVNSQSFSLPSTLKQTGNSYEDRTQQQPLEKIESVSFSSSPVLPTSSSQYNQQQQLNGRSKTPTSIASASTWQWQLCYVTERILAAVLPAKETSPHSQKVDDLFYDESSKKRRNDKYEADLLHMLEQKHGKNFRLFDLESCMSTISLEKLCELCKHIETWLNGGQSKIVVLQDRESFQRVGACVAAYLQYQKICSSNLAPYSLKSLDNSRNIQDLDEYSMQKFLEDTVGPITQPSYKRYLEYFIGLLSGEIKINSLPLYLKFIKMESPPCMHHKISKYESEWSSFIKIFEGERFVFISDIYVMPISTKQFIYEIKSPIILRGDIFIHFFQIHNKSRQTELISSIQFHTCAITRNEIEFFKNDVSYPNNDLDEKFPPDHKVTLIFTKSPEKVGYNHEIDDVLIFQNPLIRKEPISNYSSIADLSQYAQQHTQGPLDGSLYATIAKNSPGNNELTVQNIQTIETRLNTPISKNSRILSTILEWDNVRNENGLHHNHDMVDGDANYSQIITASSSARSRPAPIEPPPRSYVKSPLQRSFDSGIYSHEITNKNNTSSALSWHDRASPTASNNCHDELDNLLSEMLLTVEALPDINYTNAASTVNKQQINTIKKSAASPTPMKMESITTTETIKRSPKYTQNYDTFNYAKNNQQDIGETSSITTTLTPTESGRNTPALSDHQFNKNYYTNQDELFYDTDTQMQLHSSRKYHTHMSDEYSPRQNENQLSHSQSQSYMEVLRSENGKALVAGRYPRSHQDDESNIPYHAREYSKPFTYLPSGKMQPGLSSPSMVRKALNNGTSGRKTPSPQVDFAERTRTYGGRQYNESKYTFGDKTPDSNLSVFDSDKVFNDLNQRNRSENGRNSDSIGRGEVVETVTTTTRHFEPLRRSNTMDGSFGRSGYASDGGSSQTWLQVQQQRLRAKRAQRQHEGFDFTDGTLSRRGQTLSPVRQLNNYNYTLTSPKEPKFVQVKRVTEQQTLSRPYKNEVEMSNQSLDYNQSQTVSPTYSRSSYNEKSVTNHVGNGVTRRSLPITSTPNEEMTRNESVSSYRSETETEVSRPETPAFPVTPRTPIHFGSTSTLPPKSPTLQRRDLSNRIHEVANINETVSTYTSRRNSSNSGISIANSEPFEIAPHHVKFARDSSRYWYKPSLSREEAISLLRNAAPGTFLVRDSTTFANAFGLVVRVAQPPPGSKGGIDELVRHFLVEPTARGVRLKGCSNEPVFSSLSALIYQHSVTPLALPCRLILPERDVQNIESTSVQQVNAACNVLYLFSADTESLTGPQAVRKAVRLLFERRPLPSPTEVHFKVSKLGITLTDNSRQVFFRKHYPAPTISYVGLDPDDRRWSVQITNADVPVKNQHVFAFVAKKTATSNDNQCHIFCELENRQPASAIVSFGQKVLMDETARYQHAPAQI